jgi:stage III sporulation protein AA
LRSICYVDKPIIVNIRGNNFYLSNYGTTADYSNAIICDKELIDSILLKASNNSLYTINDQLIKGYVTVSGGIRIGVAGDVVTIDNEIKTVKNIKSLNIRIPHDIKNCSLNLYNYLVENKKVKNTLIISPPGAGKTTFVRDFAYQLGKRETTLNVLIVDERGEISGVNFGEGLDVGDFTDVYSNCTKEYAFENGIRSMKPDVIITDEINLSTDLLAIENAITSGVNVVATIHAVDVNDLKLKKSFLNILNNKLFSRFVVLSSNRGPGTIEAVYNENLVCVYC